MSDQFERDILQRVEALEALSVAVADMVVGITREEYAKNILSIEQEPLGAEFRVKQNADLLEKMATILALKVRVEGKPQGRMPLDDLITGLKRSLERSVEEYLLGMREALDDGSS